MSRHLPRVLKVTLSPVTHIGVIWLLLHLVRTSGEESACLQHKNWNDEICQTRCTLWCRWLNPSAWSTVVTEHFVHSWRSISDASLWWIDHLHINNYNDAMYFSYSPFWRRCCKRKASLNANWSRDIWETTPMLLISELSAASWSVCS